MLRYWRAVLAGVLWATAVLAQQRHPLLHAGPMAGYATMREACIWVQTTAPAQVQVAYWDSLSPQRRFWSQPVQTSAQNAYVAHLLLDSLLPGRVYFYELWLNGEPVRLPYQPRFRTPPLWRWRGEPPTFRIALGSCAFINDTAFDRPGPPYGGEYEIFESIARLQPDVMLWLGDNVYLRESDWDSRTGVLRRYSHDRALPQLQRLLATTTHYAIWDDHDYGPNDSDRSFVHKFTTLEAFRLFWCNPTMGIDGLPGITTVVSWGDVDLFLLDNRFWRTPNALRSVERTILGEHQLRWLQEALVSSRARFKLVVMGGQFLNPLPVFETYSNCAPEERQRLLEWLQQQRIPGVLFVSGDRHFTELSRLERPGTYPLYELTVSPLTASPFAGADNEANPLRVPGTLVVQRNFAVLEFTGPARERRVVIRVYSAQGKLLWERTLWARELEP
jgi:alkaline phosphatase D